jgi:two-component system response regulator FixJ
VLSINQFHIVDRDGRRRAQIAFQLARSGHQAHVYENIDELERFAPREGLVLLEDGDPRAFDALRKSHRERGVYVPIVLFADEPEAPRVVNAIHGGAIDYLKWPLASEDVLDRLAFRASRARRLANRRFEAAALVDGLSKRERQVLTAMIAGISSKAIGILLGISSRTVEIHRGNVLRKLKVDTSSSAVRVGIYAGIDEDDADNP